MKKRWSMLLGLLSILFVAGGCVVRAPGPHLAIRPARVQVHAPAVRVDVRPAHCNRRRCRRVCNLWGCWDRCHDVAYPCY